MATPLVALVEECGECSARRYGRAKVRSEVYRGWVGIEGDGEGNVDEGIGG